MEKGEGERGREEIESVREGESGRCLYIYIVCRVMY